MMNVNEYEFPKLTLLRLCAQRAAKGDVNCSAQIQDFFQGVGVVMVMLYVVCKYLITY